MTGSKCLGEVARADGSVVCNEHAVLLRALNERYWRCSQVQQKVSSDIESIDTELVRSLINSILSQLSNGVVLCNELNTWMKQIGGPSNLATKQVPGLMTRTAAAAVLQCGVESATVRGAGCYTHLVRSQRQSTSFSMLSGVE